MPPAPHECDRVLFVVINTAHHVKTAGLYARIFAKIVERSLKYFIAWRKEYFVVGNRCGANARIPSFQMA